MIDECDTGPCLLGLAWNPKTNDHVDLCVFVKLVWTHVILQSKCRILCRSSHALSFLRKIQVLKVRKAFLLDYT